MPSASTSSQGASPDVAISATSAEPPTPEKIKLLSEAQSTPETNVPDPAGTKPPENEKPRTVVALPCTMNPDEVASPPLAPVAQPS